MTSPPAFLRSLFDAAVAAADPARVVSPHLPPPSSGRLVVAGAGKASAAMAQAVDRAWPGALEGLVVTAYGHAVPCERVEVVEAAHPTPDAAGERAARRMLDLARGLGEGDLLLALISGGGSALLPLPLPGLTLADVQATNRALLASGATIGEINIVRRHASAIQGGRLAAAAWPAETLALVISDTPGDRLHDIASGPTVADPTTCADALAVLRRYGVRAPPALLRALEDGGAESVELGDPRLARSHTRLVATPALALEAAAAAARAAGVGAHVLGDALEGESRDLARAQAALAREVSRSGLPCAPPCVLISGGETTVTLAGGPAGRGGRNAEFALALALALDGAPGVHAIAADTDGVDGSEPVAGAVVGPDTLAHARALGLDPRAALDGHDAHALFEALGDGVITGPTRTNVNDFRAVLVEG